MRNPPTMARLSSREQGTTGKPRATHVSATDRCCSVRFPDGRAFAVDEVFRLWLSRGVGGCLSAGALTCAFCATDAPLYGGRGRPRCGQVQVGQFFHGLKNWL